MIDGIASTQYMATTLTTSTNTIWAGMSSAGDSALHRPTYQSQSNNEIEKLIKLRQSAGARKGERRTTESKVTVQSQSSM